MFIQRFQNRPKVFVYLLQLILSKGIACESDGELYRCCQIAIYKNIFYLVTDMLQEDVV